MVDKMPHLILNCIPDAHLINAVIVVLKGEGRVLQLPTCV